ncbi:MAG: NAD(P)-dependent oxidoreductase [Promicromonosporaceae bacterium]|nr:NAD(P)-dependent oxidoreductase [Promicromonosporaceae bacterium]
MRIALLGTGHMGIELGRHILAAGHELTVWNRNPDRAEPLVAAGAHLADSAADAAQGAEIVITALFGPDTVTEVILHDDVLAPGQLWVDVTTVGPDDGERFAAWATAHKVRYVAAPMLGSTGPAKAGTLGTYLGGAAADVAAVLPIISLWTDPAKRVEVPTARAAAVGKLIANLAIAITLEGLVETLRFGRTQGLDPANILKMMSGRALGWIADSKADMINNRTFEQTQFSVDLLAKDTRLMLAAAGAETQLPALAAALASMESAQKRGAGGEDIAAVVEPELP